MLGIWVSKWVESGHSICLENDESNAFLKDEKCHYVALIHFLRKRSPRFDLAPNDYLKAQSAHFAAMKVGTQH